MKKHSLQLIQQRPEQIAESARLEIEIKQNLGGVGMNSDWSSMLLGDFIELKRGYDLPKKHRVLGKVPLISSAGLSDHHSEAKVTGPGVVTGRYGTIGEVYYVESDFWPLNTTLYIRDFKGNDPKFVYYFLKTIDYLKYSDKAAVPGVNRNHLHMASVFVPTLVREQQEIASILSALDDKIKVNQDINQTLEQMAQAIFKSWFVDFEPVKAKIAALEAGGSEDDALLAAMQAIAGSALFATDAADADAPTQLARLQAEHPEQYTTLRATAELFPSAMQESELGEIPEGWSVCQVENILERLKPVKRYTKKEVSSTGLVPVFEQGADILLGFHNENAGFTADAMSPAFVFGDHTCITHLSCQDFDISQNVIPLRGRSRPTVWVYYAIQGKQVFQEYRRHWSELIVKPVIYPANDICEQYSETVLRMILLKENLERENRSLSELRDTLLPKLLSGELSLAATEEQLADTVEPAHV